MLTNTICLSKKYNLSVQKVQPTKGDIYQHSKSWPPCQCCLFADNSLSLCVSVCLPVCLSVCLSLSHMDKSMEWSMIPVCPSLMCFFNRGSTEGTNSSKILCLMFVYVFCKFVLGPHSGELWTQKLKSHLVRTQSLNVLPLKPGVGQYIAIHAMLTARDFFLAYELFHHEQRSYRHRLNDHHLQHSSGPVTCIFSKTSPDFSCVGST